MRIVFVAHRYWPGIGGVESYVHGLALELSSRHDVTVLAHRIDDGPSDRLTDSLRPPPTFEPFQDHAVRVEPLRVSAARRAALAPLVFQAVPLLRRYAYSPVRLYAAAFYAFVVGPVMAREAGDADLLHVWSGGFFGAAAVRAARLLGVPVVVTASIHRHEWADDATSAAVYRRADRVVAQLETEAQVYRELGVPAARISLCGAGTAGIPAGGGEKIRSRHSIQGPLVLFLGARREGKGVELLLAAAPAVARRIPDVTFAFVGPGERLPPTPGDARVLDVGAVDADERAAWLDAADVLCLPSSAESFGLVVAEAWSAGTAVVVSDIPTLQELVGDAEAGIVVRRDPEAIANALSGLLADPEAVRRLAARGHDVWRERYTIERVARAHEAMYASLAGGVP